MKLKIDIQLGNAAFEAGDCGSELARILRDLARRVEPHSKDSLRDFDRPVHDINGNAVGKAKVTRS